MIYGLHDPQCWHGGKFFAGKLTNYYCFIVILYFKDSTIFTAPTISNIYICIVSQKKLCLSYYLK